MEVDKPQPNNNPQRRVFTFLEQVAKETHVSKGKARLDLARKMNERSRLVETRKKERQRLRELAKNLETTEAKIQLANEDIKKLKSVVEEGQTAKMSKIPLSFSCYSLYAWNSDLLIKHRSCRLDVFVARTIMQIAQFRIHLPYLNQSDCKKFA